MKISAVCACVCVFPSGSPVVNASTYRIAGNFRRAIFSWISWFEACAQKFYPRILEPRLFMKHVQTATTKILPRNHHLLLMYQQIYVAGQRSILLTVLRFHITMCDLFRAPVFHPFFFLGLKHYNDLRKNSNLRGREMSWPAIDPLFIS